MSNRVNEDGWRAVVYGGVSAGRTTALWFRGWPWPWWIDQPVKQPGDCLVAMTTKAPVLPSLHLTKIPGEFRGLCLDTRIIGVAVVVFRTSCCSLYLTALMSLVAVLEKERGPYTINIIDAIYCVNNIENTYPFDDSILWYVSSFFLQNGKNKRVWCSRVQLTSNSINNIYI